MEASPKVQSQGPELSLLTWHPTPGLAPLLPANGWLVVGVCSAGLDTGGNRPEICEELASKSWAPGRPALWESAGMAGEPGQAAAPAEGSMPLEREVCLEAMNRHWSF